MPTSLLTRNTMNAGQGPLDAQRAYLLAKEITKLAVDENGQAQLSLSLHNNHHHHTPHEDLMMDAFMPGSRHALEPNLYEEALYANNKRSTNMTETVPVPSSEHVAEIVGRQGCKIKALRAKTNTYIKTPVRGAEPVFVVTGRREDVGLAKAEILSAAEHFSQIRASRRNNSAGSGSGNSGSSSPTSNPGHVTSEVRVPYKVVGLVVGPKGATIKRIQQATYTYIVTPGRDKEPVFEVTGLPENVEKAREEIEKHIATRTGDSNGDFHIDDFHTNGIDSGFHDQISDEHSNGPSFTSYNNSLNLQDNRAPNPPLSTISKSNTTFHHQSPAQCNSTGAALKISEYTPLSSNFPTCSTFTADLDEGIGSGTLDHSSIWCDSYEMQRSNSISVSRVHAADEHPRTRRTNSDPLAQAFQRVGQAFGSSSPTSSPGSLSPVTGRRGISPVRRECLVCRGDVTAALVPCGHNSFCMPCASKICEQQSERRVCPICHVMPTQAIRIRTT